ncbi:MAG: hypothetical protein H6738_03000 [Alphaproteobacteria bacterium]|nr:hypothetical protein [Alphaproteobacteria bacterium]MCB9695737.1 hypothetical protein [Alphaproteobacteria bacterium]
MTELQVAWDAAEARLAADPQDLDAVQRAISAARELGRRWLERGEPSRALGFLRRADVLLEAEDLATGRRDAQLARVRAQVLGHLVEARKLLGSSDDAVREAELAILCWERVVAVDGDRKDSLARALHRLAGLLDDRRDPAAATLIVRAVALMEDAAADGTPHASVQIVHFLVDLAAITVLGDGGPGHALRCLERAMALAEGVVEPERDQLMVAVVLGHARAARRAPDVADAMAIYEPVLAWSERHRLPWWYPVELLDGLIVRVPEPDPEVLAQVQRLWSPWMSHPTSAWPPRKAPVGR